MSHILRKRIAAGKRSTQGGNVAPIRRTNGDGNRKPQGSQVQQQVLLQRRTTTQDHVQAQQPRQSSVQQQQPQQGQSNLDKSMQQTMEDVLLLEELQREAQRRVAQAELAKQNQLDQRTSFEKQLTFLKYSNGEKRAQIVRSRELLSSSHRELTALNTASERNGDGIRRMEMKLRKGLEARRDVGILQRQVELRLSLLTQKQILANQLHAKATEKLEANVKICQELEERQHVLAKCRQEELAKIQKIAEMTASARSEGLRLQEELTIARQHESSAKNKAESAARELAAEERRSAAAIAEVNERIRILESKKESLRAENLERQKGIDESNEVLQGLRSRILEYYKGDAEGGSVSSESVLEQLQQSLARAQEALNEQVASKKRTQASLESTVLETTKKNEAIAIMKEKCQAISERLREGKALEEARQASAEAKHNKLTQMRDEVATLRIKLDELAKAREEARVDGERLIAEQTQVHEKQIDDLAQALQEQQFEKGLLDDAKKVKQELDDENRVKLERARDRLDAAQKKAALLRERAEQMPSDEDYEMKVQEDIEAIKVVKAFQMRGVHEEIEAMRKKYAPLRDFEYVCDTSKSVEELAREVFATIFARCEEVLQKARQRRDDELQRRADEAQRQRDEEEKRQRDEESQRQREEEARKQREEEARMQREEEAKQQRDEEARKQRDEEARIRRDADARKKRDDEARKLRDEKARKRRDDEARKKRDDDAKKQRDDEAKKLRDEKARKRRDDEARKKRDDDAREAKKKLDETKKRRDDEAKKQRDDKAAKRRDDKASEKPDGPDITEAKGISKHTHSEGTKHQKASHSRKVTFQDHIGTSPLRKDAYKSQRSRETVEVQLDASNSPPFAVADDINSFTHTVFPERDSEAKPRVLLPAFTQASWDEGSLDSTEEVKRDHWDPNETNSERDTKNESAPRRSSDNGMPHVSKPRRSYGTAKIVKGAMSRHHMPPRHSDSSPDNEASRGRGLPLVACDDLESYRKMHSGGLQSSLGQDGMTDLSGHESTVVSKAMQPPVGTQKRAENVSSSKHHDDIVRSKRHDVSPHGSKSKDRGKLAVPHEATKRSGTGAILRHHRPAKSSPEKGASHGHHFTHVSLGRNSTSDVGFDPQDGASDGVNEKKRKSSVTDRVDNHNPRTKREAAPGESKPPNSKFGQSVVAREASKKRKTDLKLEPWSADAKVGKPSFVMRNDTLDHSEDAGAGTKKRKAVSGAEPSSKRARKTSVESIHAQGSKTEASKEGSKAMISKVSSKSSSRESSKSKQAAKGSTQASGISSMERVPPKRPKKKASAPKVSRGLAPLDDIDEYNFHPPTR